MPDPATGPEPTAYDAKAGAGQFGRDPLGPESGRIAEAPGNSPLEFVIGAMPDLSGPPSVTGGPSRSTN